MHSGRQADVSVIIPTYNRASYILPAISSVLDQQNPGVSFEILVIDDGSTDDTESVLQAVMNRIRYYKIPGSKRPAVPRNYGLNLARGEFIAFQDSDDLWVPNKLQQQMPVFADQHVIASYGNAQFMDQSGELQPGLILEKDQAKNGSIFTDLLESNFISTLTVIVRAAALKEIGGFNESWSLRGVEDYELWLRLATKGRFAYIDAPLAYYRKHDNNISSNDPKVSLRRLLNVYSSLLKFKLAATEMSAIRSRLASCQREAAGHIGGIEGTRLRLSAKINEKRVR